MQSIITKYLPATNTRGARIKATASGCNRSVTISFPYERAFDSDGAHWHAAKTLLAELPWPNVKWHCGNTKTGCVFVPDSNSTFSI